jgi:serine O-acetyltransferase
MGEKFQDNLTQLVSAIALGNREHVYTAQGATGQLPNHEEIIEITKLLRELLFPGYFGKRNLDEKSIDYHIGDLLITINEKLKEQIASLLRHRSDVDDALRGVDPCEKAEDICCKFFRKLPMIREYLVSDVQATFDGDPAAFDKDEVIFSYPGILAISVYRLAHELYLLSVPLIPRIMTEYAHSKTGIDINAGATIGKYFFIDHGTGIVIGETTEIGNNVKIYQGVTLGALSTRGGQSLRGKKRHPTLEDDVTVYSGASIFGGETVIGRGAVIGSNVFITQSIPAGTKVSIKNPDLLFKGGELNKPKAELNNDWGV